MTSYTFIRAIYRRARSLPVIGALVEALRYRRFPVFSSARKRYAEQQAMLEAHGLALAGLRHAIASAMQSSSEDKARLETELYAQVHGLNLRLDKQQSELDQRLEFVRQEIFYEMQYRHRGIEKTETPVRIVNPEKIDAQRQAGKICLNIGCGHKPDPDRINVDMRELPGVDIVAAVDKIPFAAGELQEIYSSHLLEHFSLEQLRRQLLPQWCELLAKGGELRAVVPDAQAMLEAYAKHEIPFSELHLVMYGGQEYEGDFHFTMFTPESLVELFVEQGLENVHIEARKRRNGLCYECEVVGAK